MRQTLRGYKTYIAAAITFLIGGAAAIGVITDEQAEHLYPLMAAILAATFRSAMAEQK